MASVHRLAVGACDGCLSVYCKQFESAAALFASVVVSTAVAALNDVCQQHCGGKATRGAEESIFVLITGACRTRRADDDSFAWSDSDEDADSNAEFISHTTHRRRAQRARHAAEDDINFTKREVKDRHDYGREVLLPAGHCVVCHGSQGVLEKCKKPHCPRLYHTECLHLLSQAGICPGGAGDRKWVITNSAANHLKGSTSNQLEASGQCSGRPVAPGLLGLDASISMQPQVETATSAGRNHHHEVQVVQELMLPGSANHKHKQPHHHRRNCQSAVNCPAHHCHGCLMDGKWSKMVWCCVCWVRTYHHPSCIPKSAEPVDIHGKLYVKCPWYRVAKQQQQRDNQINQQHAHVHADLTMQQNAQCCNEGTASQHAMQPQQQQVLVEQQVHNIPGSAADLLQHMSEQHLTGMQIIDVQPQQEQQPEPTSFASGPGTPVRLQQPTAVYVQRNSHRLGA